jgi:hypothetical protein
VSSNDSFGCRSLGAISLAGTPAGIWKMTAARSTFSGDIQPKSLTLRIEVHAKGEGFTPDRIEADGRATSSSTILWFERHCRGRRRCRRRLNAIRAAIAGAAERDGSGDYGPAAGRPPV